MTSPFQPRQVPGSTPAAAGAGRRGVPALPTPPKGWPVGSYPTYAEAQRAVDYLSEQQFPVQQVTIVGVDLMQVERVTGRLTWPKVLGGGVLVAPGWACSSGWCSGSSVPIHGPRWLPAWWPGCSSG